MTHEFGCIFLGERAEEDDGRSLPHCGDIGNLYFTSSRTQILGAEAFGVGVDEGGGCGRRMPGEANSWQSRRQLRHQLVIGAGDDGGDQS